MSAVDLRIHDDGKENKIRVTFDFDMADVASVKRVAGAKFQPADKGGPYWLVPLSVENCRQLRSLFGKRLVIQPDLKRWATIHINRNNQLRSLAVADDADLENLPKLLPKMYDFISGRPYQKADVKFMAENEAPLNANQPGLGKTVETIASIFESGRHEGSHLIASPKTSLDVVWEMELSRFGQPFPVLVAPEGKAPREAVLRTALRYANSGQPFWLVVNPAMITYKATFEMCDDHARMKAKPRVHEMRTCPLCVEKKLANFPELFDIHWSHKVIDEFHKCGLTNTATATAQAMNDIKADKSIGISGTPIGGKPIKLYGILHFLRPEEFSSKWRFADQWLEVMDNGYGKVIGGIRKDREEEFFEMLSRFMLRRTKAEVLKDLPPKQYQEIWVPMEKKTLQEKQYREFQDMAAIKIGEEDLSATSILAEYTRLKQFAGAAQDVEKKWVEQNDGELREALVLHPVLGESNKLAQVERILNEVGIDPKDDMEGDEQVVIFSQFSEMVDMVTEWLAKQGYPVAKLTGATSRKERTRLVEGFQEEGGLRVLVMTTTAGGVSITLDKASTVIFLDETWVPDDQEQAEDRCHRGSRFHQVRVIYIRSQDTIEAMIADQVRDKQDINDLILDIRRQIVQK